MINKTRFIIIGAGLSGLTTAYFLQKNGVTDFLILESRDRIGGRINTKNGIDLGATWFHDHHNHLNALINEFDIEKFPQYSTGKGVFVYNSMLPAQYFDSDPNDPAASRIVGGTLEIIRRLAANVSNNIKLNTTVESIQYDGNDILVKTDTLSFLAEKVICTIPPKLASEIKYLPQLPDPLLQTMKTTHTWMSNAIKIGITYETPFWRDDHMSGTIVGQIAPTIELYDHSQEGHSYSLMGFINEGLRDDAPENRKERILSHIEKYLGSKTREYIAYQEYDWSMDKHTSSQELKSVYISPRYGNPIFDTDYMNGKLLFSGAETSPISGGYMDGAVWSGIHIANKLLKK